MFYQIKDDTQREKLEKYCKRMNIEFSSSETVEEMYVLEKINLIQNIVENIPFEFLLRKRTKHTEAGEESESLLDVISSLRENIGTIVESEPLFSELEASILKRYDQILFNDHQEETAKAV